MTNLAIIISFVVTIPIISRLLIQRTRRYARVMQLGPPLMAIGCGLLYGFNMLTRPTAYLGFQIFIGVGSGCWAQVTLVRPGSDIRLLS